MSDLNYEEIYGPATPSTSSGVSGDSSAFWNYLSNNPGFAGALMGGIGTFVDPAKSTTTTRSQAVSLPSYIAPYVGRVLDRAEGLSQEGYAPYSEQRIADFSPDQLAAFQRWREMNPNTPLQGQGAGIVGQAATSLLDPNRWDQSAADHYMAPYMQSVVDIQTREAQRNFDKALPVLDAQAVKSGAYGGSRQGIVEAEMRRNLAQQLGDIQVQGSQSAYTNAQGQFNADENRRLSGTSTAGTLGNTLAGIGQTGFQNQLAINQGLMGIGGQQQNLQQKSLDTGYQDFLRQQQYPYDQLNFARTAYQGLPMTQSTTANFTPAPTMTQQLLGNMAAGYGIGSYTPQPVKGP